MSNSDSNPSAAQQAAVSTDLELAYKTLRAKAPDYDECWRYYRGEHPQKLMEAILLRIFKNKKVRFIRNWCKVVIKSTADRIHLEGFEVIGDETATKKLAELVDQTELLIEADDAHDGALVVGESFIIAGKGDDERFEVTYNDARLCHLFYESANPRQPRMGAKWWVDEMNGLLYITLYYADHFEYYVSDKKADSVESAASLHPDPDLPRAENPYKRIPFFHLRPDTTGVVSDLNDAMPIQDQINILSTNLMIAAGFGGSPQKFVISASDPTANLKIAPDSIMAIPAGDGMGQQTQVGQFAATDLDNFNKALDGLVNDMSAITSTPKFYFFGQGGDPSGEALITMESPLVMKARDRIDRFTLVWRQVASFLLKLAGVDVPPGKIMPKFANPRTVQPKTQAEIRQINTAAGMPLVSALRDEGKTQPEIDQVLKDKTEEEAAKSNSLAVALVNQARSFDQNRGTTGA